MDKAAEKIAPKHPKRGGAASDSSPPRSGSGGLVILAYAATIFFSAFLLFQVQPLISRFILPWFGGSPAVWTAAMLFFQLALFGGYLYAHLTSTYLSPRGQFLLHAGLLVVAAIVTLVTHISPGEWLKPRGEEGESPLLQILLLLGVTVGLPYFVLSSTGPLLQKWFSDAFEGISPYRLFALSNFGSLLALLSYPFFFEVYWDSPEQARLWSYGFAFFSVFCAFCAWWTFQARAAHVPHGGRESLAEKDLADQNASSRQRLPTPSDDPSPGVARWIAWIGLPSLASVMFLAVTNEVTQNVATVPLLWIIPLSLYLVSFIVAFDHPRWYSRPIYAALAVVVLLYMSDYRTLSIVVEDLLHISFRHNLGWRCTVFFSGLFLVCMICHCELAALKPSTKHLTAFYMTMSLGGALGGILVNLVAPYVFSTYFELPLSLLVSICIAAALLVLSFTRGSKAAVPEVQTPPARPRIASGAAALVGAVAVLYIAWKVADDVFHVPDPTSPYVYQGRNFYGLVSARHNNTHTPEEAYLTFKSGSVAHGRQWSHPARQRDTEIAYWGPGSGCRRALEYSTAKNEKCKIGVVGLGIGTIAGFAKPGQHVRMYEINPQAIDIAENIFFFLKNATADGVEIPPVVLGDARLQLERELVQDSHQFDVLCLDAFSGDAVPMHLLTTEAFAIYKQHLKPDGIIVANVTNTYLDLYPVVRRLAEEHGFKHTRVFADPDKDKCFPTYFVLITNDEEFLRLTPETMKGAPEGYLKQREAPLWTDQYHSLWHVLQ